MTNEAAVAIIVGIIAQVVATLVGSAIEKKLKSRPSLRSILLITFPLTVFVGIVLWFAIIPKAEEGVKIANEAKAEADDAKEEATDARVVVDRLSVTHVDMSFSTDPERDGGNFKPLAADTPYPIDFGLPKDAEILTVWQSLISRNGDAVNDAAFDPSVSKDKKSANIMVTAVDSEANEGKRSGRVTVRIYALYTIKPSGEAQTNEP